MKKVFKITVFITLALILLFVAAVCVSLFSVESSYSGSVGIIGGADGPTAILITETLLFWNPLFWLLCLVFVVFIASAIGWLITRNK